MAEGREIGELAHEEEDSGESDNDSGTDPEELTGPPEPKRSRKHSGAATYRTKFNPDWKSSPSLPPCLRIHTDFGAIHVTKQLGVITWENKMSSSIAKRKAIKTELNHSSLNQN